VPFLVAGMGDAVSTYFEARTCFQNPNARTALGGRVTLAAHAIARLCAETIYDHGADAARALEQGEVTDAVERVAGRCTRGRYSADYHSGGARVGAPR